MDEGLSLAQRLRVIAESLELAERHDFMDNDVRTSAALALSGIVRELQAPVIDAVLDTMEPASRQERKVLHRLRAKLAVVKKPENSTKEPAPAE